MTEEQIKEQLALFYFCLLAARMGCKIKKANIADGTDVEIELTTSYPRGDRLRYFSLGRSVEVQLKTTTKKGIAQGNGFISYDLDVKNFDDLIFRRNWRKTSKAETTPLILVLLVLPEDKNEWIQFSTDKEKATIGGSLFWFYPPDELDYTKREFKTRIRIPVENKFNLDFFEDVFRLPFL
ncbi:MAG: DUF4365 domain-containing protein [Bacteroidota bacterium]